MSNNTKEEILAAAAELFAAGGYYDTSMSEIAKKAKTSKGTLYWYFSGKEELFEELITSGFNILFNKVENIVKQDLPATRMLYQYLKTKINFLEKHKKIAKVAVKNMETISPKMKKKAMEKHGEMINLIGGIIKKGKEEYIFKDIDTIDTAILIIGMTNCLSSSFMFKEVDDINKKVDFIYNFISDGILK